MNTKSRTQNTVINLIWSLGSQIVILLLNFFSRRLFIVYLGEELLGINGVISSILMFFSITEFGIGNILIVSLYEPIVNKDYNTIGTLLNFYRRIYYIIIMGLAGIGIIFIPFLHNFISIDGFDIRYGVIYYLLFLLDSICSYIFVEKIALINADQKIYIQKIYVCIISIIRLILQCFAIIYCKSYTLYLILQILGTVAANVLLGWYANKNYPFIKEKYPTLDKKSKGKIFLNIKSMFLFKVGVIALNNTDNILIALLVNTRAVGYFSNYSMIYNALVSITSTMLQAIYSSVGNLNANDEIEKKYQVFNELIFLFNAIATGITIGFVLCVNDFIALWLGDYYILEKSIVLVMGIRLFYTCAANPVWCYRETMGLFSEAKSLMLEASIINLLFSIPLGKIWGISGILFATVLARLLTTLTREPMIIFRKCFHRSSWEYFIREFKYIGCCIFTGIVLYKIFLAFTVETWMDWGIKGCISIGVAIIIYLLFNINTEEEKKLICVFFKKGRRNRI